MAWGRTPWTRMFIDPAFMMAASSPELARAMWLIAARNWSHEAATLDWSVGMGIDQGVLDRLVALGLMRDGWLHWMRGVRTDSDAFVAEQRRKRKGSANRGSTAVQPRCDPGQGLEQREAVETYTDSGTTPPGVTQRRSPYAPPGPAAGGGGTELTRWWDAEYEATRGVPFSWVRSPGKRGKLGPCVDAIALGYLQQQFPIAEIKDRISRFLRGRDPWNAAHATPRMFKSKYAELAVDVIEPPRRGSAEEYHARLNGVMRDL